MNEATLSRQERLHRLYNRITLCESCGLNATAFQHVVDRNLIWHLPETGVPFVAVGMAPAYCEDRVGVPLVGATELLEWRCGQCVDLIKCHGYFLHQKDSYKDDDYACAYPPGDQPTPISESRFQKRLTNVVYDARFTKDGYFDPRTAGELFNYMLETAGITRASMCDYVAETTTAPKVECAVINTVQCRSFTTEEGRVTNRPPTDDERASCKAFLPDFIDICAPKAVLCFGLEAARSIIGESITRVGILFDTDLHVEANPAIPAYVFYHPASYLHKRNAAKTPQEKQKVDDDIQLAIQRLAEIKAQYGE